MSIFLSNYKKDQMELLIEKIKKLDDFSTEYPKPEVVDYMQEIEDIFKTLNPASFRDTTIFNDKQFLRELIEVNLNCLQYLPEELQKDIEIKEAAIKSFAKYQCSGDFSLQELFYYSENIAKPLSDYDFKEEPRIIDFVKELELGYPHEKDEENFKGISLQEAIAVYDVPRRGIELSSELDLEARDTVYVSPRRGIIEINVPEKDDPEKKYDGPELDF